MLSLGMIFGYQMNEKDESPLITSMGHLGEAVSPTGQIEELIRFVETKYVDTTDAAVLTDAAIEAILQELDPHSIYISPEQLARVNEEMEGSFYGIGIETFYIDDTVSVIRALPGGPADRAGIEPYDKLIMINDSLVAGNGLQFSQIERMIRGDQGDKLELVLQDRYGKQRKATAYVGDVPLQSIDVAFDITDEIGYIRINRFSSTTYKEFMDYFEQMYESGSKHLIIDLRDNPGGYLPQATNILSQLFKEKGNLLVYTEGRKGQRIEYKTTGKPFFDVDKIAVLINEGSASGSEIIAGAIQEWDRGIIVGRRSFGKGLVQEQYDLGNGGALRLTVAKYYTPTGRSIQKSYQDLSHYDSDIHDRIVGGELFSSDSIADSKGKLYETLQLGRPVVGGGGITPDVFVPIDSVELDFQYIAAQAGVGQSAFQYLQSNPADTSATAIDAVMEALGQSTTNSGKWSQSTSEQLRDDVRRALIRYSTSEIDMLRRYTGTDPSIIAAMKYIKGDSQLPR